MNHETPESEKSNLASVDTSQLIALLRKYNSRFGWGSTLGRIISSEVRKDLSEEGEIVDTETEPDSPGVLDDQKAEELISFEEMKASANEILDSTGLKFQPMRSGFAMSGSE